MQYLISAWDDNSLVITLGESKLFVNNNNDCYSFTVKDERTRKMCEKSLYLTHEEAESYKSRNKLRNRKKLCKRCNSKFRN